MPSCCSYSSGCVSSQYPDSEQQASANCHCAFQGNSYIVSVYYFSFQFRLLEDEIITLVWIALNHLSEIVEIVFGLLSSFFSKCDVEAGLSIQSLSVFPSSYHTILDKGRYPIYLLVSEQSCLQFV